MKTTTTMIGLLLSAPLLPLRLQQGQPASALPGAAAQVTLEEARAIRGKWIETQQIISKERKDWQQGKEILLGRLELTGQESAVLREKLAQARSSVEKAQSERSALMAENERLEAAQAQLAAAAAGLEAEVRRLYQAAPAPIQERLQPLYQRIPEDPAGTRVSSAERYQNVLGILNELNKASNEITLSYEVHELAGGKPTEVRAIYIGLAQAYYVSGKGAAGIGRPTPAGWEWEPAPAIAREVLDALEIIQGKQSPAFVPLPVRIQ
jgi:hypothetical protein